jgi:ubiquitin-like protein 4
MKSPTHSLTLSEQSLSSSVFDLKQAYGNAFSLPVDKIKLLHGKKPIGDSKTLRDVLGGEGSRKGEGEFGVMVMGGAVPAATAEGAAAAAEGAAKGGDAPGLAKGAQASGSAAAALDGKFWDDLKGFLEQRLKNEAQAEALAAKFKRAAS